MKRPAPDKVMGGHGYILISTPAHYRCQGLVCRQKMRARTPQRQHPRLGRANLCALLAGGEQTVTFRRGDCGIASYRASLELWMAAEMWTRLTVKVLIAVTVTLALSLAPLAASAQQAAPAETEQRPAWDTSEQFPPAWEKALRALGDDTLYLLTSPLRLTPESALILGGIAAGVAGLALADRSIRSALAPHRHDQLRDAADDVALLGNAGVLFGLNVGAIAIGAGLQEATGNSKLLDAALVATEAQLLTAVFTEGIAYGPARARPRHANDPGDWFSNCGRESFPSSHPAQAFAVAAVTDDRFGLGPWTVAYGLAGQGGAAPPRPDQY